MGNTIGYTVCENGGEKVNEYWLGILRVAFRYANDADLDIPKTEEFSLKD